MTALLVIAILVLLIVVHELGHFLVAKFFKVRVEEFGVGYPPRAFLIGTWNKTEYTLNWLPFGGFVRLYGDDGDFHKGHGSITDAPRLVQAAILIAGVTANALLAYVLFAQALVIGVPSIVTAPVPGQATHLFISDIVPGSPAASTGIVPGDEILQVTDAKDQKLESLTPEGMLEYVKSRGGKDVTITYQHGDEVKTATIQPANAVVPDAAGRPALGVGLALVANQALSVPDAMYKAIFVTADAFITTAQNLWSTIVGLFVGKGDLTDIVGPVGLVSVVHIASENGFGNVIKLAAFISVNLAIINLIPVPALDGGRLVTLAIEAVRRRALPRLGVQIMNVVSLLLVAALMIAVTYNDIGRLLS